MDSFTKEFPDAFTLGEMNGKKMKVRAKYYRDFLSEQNQAPHPLSVSEETVQTESTPGIIQEQNQAQEQSVTVPGMMENQEDVRRPEPEEVKQRILSSRPAIFDSNRELSLKPFAKGADTLSERIRVAGETSRENASRNARYDEKELSRRISDAKKKLDEERSEIESRFGYADDFIGYNESHFKSLTDRKFTLDAASDLNDQSNEVIDEAARKGNTTFFGGLLRGMKDGAFDIDSWTFGITDLVNGLQIKNVLEKADRGEQLTEDEQILADAAVNNAAVNAFYADKLGRGYKAGKTAGESLPFMLDMLTGMAAVQSVTRASSRGLVKLATKKAREMGMKSAGTKAARGVAHTVNMAKDAALHSATFGQARVMSDYTDRTTGDVMFDADMAGNIGYAGRENLQEGIGALAKSFASQSFETGTELIGEYFSPFMKYAGKMTGVDKIGKLVPKRIAEAYNGMVGSKAFSEMKEIASRAKITDPIGEYGEEVVNNLLNTAIGDMTPEELVSLDNNIDTFLGVMPVSVLFGTVGAGSYAREKYRNEMSMRRFEKAMKEKFGEDWTGVRNVLKESEIGTARDFLKEILADKSMDDRMKHDAMMYVWASVNENVLQNADISEMPQEIEERKKEFYDKWSSAYRNMQKTHPEWEAVLDGAEQAARAGMDELDNYMQSNGITSEDEQESFTDTLFSKMNFGSYVSFVKEKAESARREAQEQVASLTNKTTGTVMQMTSGLSNKPVYILRGNIVETDEGTVDHKRSDRTVYYLDKDGKVKMASIGMFEKVYSNIPSETMAEQAGNDAAREAEEAEREEVDPTIPVGTAFENDGDRFVVGPRLPDGYTVHRMDKDGNIAGTDVMDSRKLQEMLGQETGNEMDGENVQDEQKEAGQEEVAPVKKSADMQEATEVAASEQQEMQHEIQKEIQQEQAAPRETPKLEDGTTDYEKLLSEGSPMEFYQAFSSEFGTDAANNEMAIQRDQTVSEADKIEKKIPRMTNPNERANSLRRVAYLRKKAKEYDSLIGGRKYKTSKMPIAEEKKVVPQESLTEQAEKEVKEMQQQVAARTPEEQARRQENVQKRIDDGSILAKPKKVRFSNEEASMGEPVTMREYVAREIASGRTTFRWSDQGSTKGVGSHVVNGEGERRKRIWALDNTNGLLPEVAAEKILESMPEGMKAKYGFDDVFNTINELLLSYSSPTTMWEEEVRKNQRMLEDETMQPGYEEYAERMAAEWEAEQNHMSVEDWNVLCEIAESELSLMAELWTDDRINAIFADIINEINKNNGQGTNEEEGAGNTERPTEDEGSVEDGTGFGPDKKGTAGESGHQYTEITYGEGSSGNGSIPVGIDNAISKAEGETDEQPTEAQKEAGNYRKGHVNIDGLDISIENPKGSERSGLDADGKPWSVKMNNTYGYIRRTEGVDGDHIDVFLSDNMEGWNSTVFVVDQVNPDGTFDEHKVMYGFNSAEEAKSAYMSNYSEDWKGFGNISGVSKEEFKKWIDSSRRKTKPFAEYKNVKPLADSTAKTDNQGNPLKEDGTLKLEKITSVDDLTDEDFSAPTRNVQLPALPKNIDEAIGADGKPVIIKKNIFEKNWKSHKFPFDESRNILKSALYDTDLVGQTQPTKKPLHWVAIKLDDKSPIVILEVNESKDNTEIVGWYTLDERNLERIKRQANKNGGELIVLSPKDKVESLSTPLDDLSSAGKVIQKTDNKKGKDGKLSSEETEDKQANELEKGIVLPTHKEWTRYINNEAGTIASVSGDPKMGYLVRYYSNEADYNDGLSIGEQMLSPEDFKQRVENGQLSAENKMVGQDNRQFGERVTIERETSWPKISDEKKIVTKNQKGGKKSDSVTIDAAIIGDDLYIRWKGAYVKSKKGSIIRIPDAAKYSAGEIRYRIESGAGMTTDAARLAGDAVMELFWKNGIRLQKKTGESYSKENERALRDALVGKLRDAGIGVITDSDEGQRVLDNAKDAIRNDEKLRRQKDSNNSALESKDNEYIEAIKSGDTDKSRKMIEYEAERKGYQLQNGFYVKSGFNEQKPRKFDLNAYGLGRFLHDKYNGKIDYSNEDYEKEYPEFGELSLNDIFASSNTAQYYYECGTNGLPLPEHVFARRIGLIPESQLSYNYRDDTLEHGVSVLGLYDKSGFKEQNNGTYRIFNDGKEYVVEGFYGGLKGSDGEPLITRARALGDTHSLIKSSDVVTHDDNGNVIPLSSRFDESKSDVRYFRTSAGDVYGFVKDGKIYIDQRMINAETPIHEYAHLWSSALREGNPEGWNNVVGLMKGTSVWDEVKENYPELESDDDIADEVIAQYSGNRGAERLREEMKKSADPNKGLSERIAAVNAIGKIKEALSRFWKNVADFLNIKYESADEVADKILSDLLNGVNPGVDGLSGEVRYATNSEEYEIVVRAKADGTYMKAPNGKKSKLSPRQWVQVRTKAFKDWFGDWEIGHKVLNIVSSSKEHGFKNFDDAKAWAKDNIVRTLKNEETGNKGEIRISNNAVSKYISESAVSKSESKDVHLSVLKVLPDVIRESVDAEQHPDHKKGADGKRSEENGVNENVTIHRLYGAVNIDGNTYRVKVTLKEYADSNRPQKAYSYEATKIELLAGTLVGGQASNPSTNNSISAANLLKDVEKSYGNGKKLIDCSKVVDENGEPMVVYHGSGKWFRIFNGKRIVHQSNAANNTIYMSDNRKMAESYVPGHWYGVSDGTESNPVKDVILDEDSPLHEKYSWGVYRSGGIYPLFADIKRPYVVDFQGKVFREGIDGMSIDEIVVQAREEGYDGVIANNIKDVGMTDEKDIPVSTDVIAYNATQVKSATDNIGTFDKANPDIRYRFVGEKSSDYGYKSSSDAKSASYKTQGGEQVSWQSLFTEEEMQGISSNEKAEETFNPTNIRLRPLQDGEQCHVERRYIENGMFDFTGKEKIESMADVAYIFRQLENASVENSFLVLVKDGIPTVIHLGMGSYSSVMAPFGQAFVAYSDLKPDEVFFVHNHPSGNLKASKQDQDTIDQLNKVFGRDIVNPGIIIDTTSGKYGVFDGFNIEENMPESQDGEVPIKVYNFGKQVFARDWNPKNAFKIGGAYDVAEFVSSHRLGEHDKMSLLILGNDNSIVANVFLPFTKLRLLENRDEFMSACDLMASYVHQCGGVREIIYGNYEYSEADGRLLGKISMRMKELGAPLLDAIHIEHSARDEGWVSEPDVTEYSKAEEKEVTEENDVRPRDSEVDITSVNDKFNEQLSMLNEENKDKIVLSLGMPSEILLSAGIEDKPMKLYGNKVIKKMKKHGFALDELKDLPRAVASPIAVFDNLGREGNRGILTELRTEQGNFLVTVDLGKGEDDIDFNIISSVFGKSDNKVVDWINKGIATYINKEKALNYLHHSAPIAEALSNPRLVSAANIVENFENPSILQDNSGMETEEITSSISESVNSLSEKILPGKVRCIVNIDELDASMQRSINEAHEKGRRVPGWYDTKTRKVTLFLPDIRDIHDAHATLLHEGVAHYGLRQLVGEENMDGFLDEIFRSLPDKARKEVTEDALSRGYDFRVATEEYMARIAEKGVEPTVWEKVKHLFHTLMKKMGFDMKTSDNEIKYILWRSARNLDMESPFDMAEDIAMQYSTGTNPRYTEEKEGSIRYRDVSDSDGSREEYDQSLKGWRYKAKEAYQDSMLALKMLQEAVENASGKKIRPFENAYMAENRLSSMNTSNARSFFDDKFRPMMKEAGKIMKEGGITCKEIERYMMLAHGIERNAWMTVRKAAEELRSGGMEDEAEKITSDFVSQRDSLRTRYSGSEYLERLSALVPDTDDYSASQAILKDMDGQDHPEFMKDALLHVKEFEKSHDTKGLWKAVKSATSFALAKSRESGMTGKEMYDNVSSMYMYYIPLRGWEDDTAEDVYEYLTSETSPTNSALKLAKGRNSIPDSPFAVIGNMGESAIVQGNRNVMKQHLLNMALNHPTDVISVRKAWYVKDANGEWVLSMPAINEGDDVSEVLRRHEEMMNRMKEQGTATTKTKGLDINYRASASQKNEHSVRVKADGKEYIIYVNGNPRAAQAVNGLTNPQITDFKPMQAMDWLNRTMAANFTTRNPAFVLGNLTRDLIFSMAATAVKEGNGYSLRFGRNVITAMSAVKRNLSGKCDPSSDEADRYFKEFIDFGGETGYMHLNDVNTYKRLVKSELSKFDGSANKAMEAIRFAARRFEDFNRWAEDISRFAVYMTSRQSGRSISDSIGDAKEITVNFNKKGAGFKSIGKNDSAVMKSFGFTAGTMRSFYMFFNAGVQSLANFAKTGKKNPKRMAAVLGSFTAAGIMMPLVNEMLCMMLGGDGEDNQYYDLPEWVRRNNVCIYTGGGKFFTLPLPIELRAFYGLGEMSVCYLSGKKDGGTFDILYDGANQITELLPLNPLGNDGDIMKELVPDALSPLFETFVWNSDFTGKPIAKTSTFNERDPEWKRVYSGTSGWLVDSSRFLNGLTNGNEPGGDFRKGTVDINPAKLEHLAESYFGGMAKTFNQAAKTLYYTGKSIYEAKMDENLTTRNIPIANRFISSVDERSAFSSSNANYFIMKDRMEDFGHVIRSLKREMKANPDYVRQLGEIMEGDEYPRYLIFKQYEKEIDRLQDAAKKAGPEKKDAIMQNVYILRRKAVEAVR